MGQSFLFWVKQEGIPCPTYRIVTLCQNFLRTRESQKKLENLYVPCPACNMNGSLVMPLLSENEEDVSLQYPPETSWSALPHSSPGAARPFHFRPDWWLLATGSMRMSFSCCKPEWKDSLRVLWHEGPAPLDGTLKALQELPGTCFAPQQRTPKTAPSSKRKWADWWKTILHLH